MRALLIGGMFSVKTCHGCKRDLPANKSHFYVSKRTKDGFLASCKECSGGKFPQPKTIPKQGYKICSKCGEEFVLSTDNFERIKGCTDGFRGVCRNCQKEGKKRYYQSNIEHIEEKCRLYRESHRQENSEYFKKRHRENREVLCAKSRSYYHAHKEEVKFYKQRNKVAIAISMSKYHQSNKATIAIRQKKYQDDNKELLSEKRRKYTSDNLDKFRIYNQRRRALKKQLPNTLTPQQWEQCEKDFDYTCCYCGQAKKLTIEHFKPISKFGELTANNVLPACPSCNSSRGNRDFSTWFKRQPFYTPEREAKILSYLGYVNGVQQLSLV